jgi:4a-hydroxytetrahydrobiopterin dehydratase
MSTALKERHCRQDTEKLQSDSVQQLMGELDREWSLGEDGQSISRAFRFKNYYRTIAFVNALAWIAHREDHHPDLEVGYNRCVVNYSTHSVGGLSENDFICAARIDALVCNGD